MPEILTLPSPPSYDDYNSVWTSTPAWLAQRSWQNPSNARDTPSATTWNAPNTTLFEYLSQNPVQGARFGCMMAMQAGGKTMWADEGAYPVRERLGNVKDDGEVLVVDIGGGAGHDLLGFRARYPDLKGRLVLQEMPYMVEKVKGEGACEGVVEIMGHDFYGEQPIKGSCLNLHLLCHLERGKIDGWAKSKTETLTNIHNNRSPRLLLPPNPTRLF
jgi:hypothetical protein